MGVALYQDFLLGQALADDMVTQSGTILEEECEGRVESRMESRTEISKSFPSKFNIITVWEVQPADIEHFHAVGVHSSFEILIDISS